MAPRPVAWMVVERTCGADYCDLCDDAEDGAITMAAVTGSKGAVYIHSHSPEPEHRVRVARLP